MKIKKKGFQLKMRADCTLAKGEQCKIFRVRAANRPVRGADLLHASPTPPKDILTHESGASNATLPISLK